MWGKHEAFTSTWTRRICPRRCWDIAEKSTLPGLPSQFYHPWSPINLFDTPFRIDWSGHGPLLAAVISALLTDPSWATGRAVWYPGWGLAIMCIGWASEQVTTTKKTIKQFYNMLPSRHEPDLNHRHEFLWQLYRQWGRPFFAASTWCFERINSERSPSSSSMKVWSTFDAANVGSWEDGWKNRQSGHVTKEL